MKTIGKTNCSTLRAYCKYYLLIQKPGKNCEGQPVIIECLQKSRIADNIYLQAGDKRSISFYRIQYIIKQTRVNIGNRHLGHYID